MLKQLFFVIITCFVFNKSFSQEFDDDYIIDGFTNDGHDFKLHDFKMGGGMRVKYFSRNAPQRFDSWKKGKAIMLLCSGAFSETWEQDSKPVGLTVDNGRVINRSIDRTMDGLVIVDGGYITVIDLDNLEDGLTFDDDDEIRLNPRNNLEDKMILINAAIEEKLTIFQTQLVYSVHKIRNFDNINYGNERERRFLAICYKDGNYHNIIIDVHDYLSLNKSAKYTKEVLDYAGFETSYILNLDTGDKNVFYYREDFESITPHGNNEISESTNLIVFYKYL